MTPILGWRAWILPDHVNRLVSLRSWLWLNEHFSTGEWEGPFKKSDVKPTKYCHTVMGCCLPGTPSRHGIYSFKSANRLATVMNDSASCMKDYLDIWRDSNTQLIFMMVFGQIEVFGEIVEARYGYRSEKAMIRKLYTSLPTRVNLLESLYQVEVVSNKNPVDLFKENPELQYDIPITKEYVCLPSSL